MNHLSELLERLEASEIAYKTAKTSLDNSLEYIVCREALKNARFEFSEACMSFVVDNVLNKEDEVM